MNYEEMSDFEITHAVMCAIDKDYTHAAAIYIDHGKVHFRMPTPDGNDAGAGTYDFCNNPADWGKLMEDNKINLTWWPNELILTHSYWGASTGKSWQNATSPTKPGRAISICYLKSKEAK